MSLSKKKAAVLGIAMGVCLTQATFAQDGKRVYTGIRFGGSLGTSVFVKSHLYDDYDDFDYDDFGYDKFDRKKLNGFHGMSGFLDIAPFLSFQFTDKFALQTEVMLTKFGYVGKEYYMNRFSGEKYDVKKWVASRRALLIPLLAKYTLRADDKISFQLFAGPHFIANIGKWKEIYYEEQLILGDNVNDVNFMFMKDEVSIPPFGFTVGTNFGFITKPGTFFLDVRFLGDIGAVRKIVEGLSYYDERYGYSGLFGIVNYIYRSKLSFSLGYEFGFGNR